MNIELNCRADCGKRDGLIDKCIELDNIHPILSLTKFLHVHLYNFLLCHHSIPQLPSPQRPPLPISIVRRDRNLSMQRSSKTNHVSMNSCLLGSLFNSEGGTNQVALALLRVAAASQRIARLNASTGANSICRALASNERVILERYAGKSHGDGGEDSDKNGGETHIDGLKDWFAVQRLEWIVGCGMMEQTEQKATTLYTSSASRFIPSVLSCPHSVSYVPPHAGRLTDRSPVKLGPEFARSGDPMSMSPVGIDNAPPLLPRLQE